MTSAPERPVPPLTQPAVFVAGVRMSATSFDDAVEWLVESVESGRDSYAVRLANSYCIALAQHDVGYGELLSHPRGVNLPDGTPVYRAMKLAAEREGLTVERVRGPSFFTAVLEQAQGRDVRHFLLGASPSTLEKLRAEVQHRFPGAEIAGAYSPPFAPVDDRFLEDCQARVVDSRANLVWVGLGTPKQDLVAQLLRDRTGLWTAGVGAAFDFVAGTTPEAPQWMQRAGLEWVFRFASEPRRLWRRYVFGNLRFLASLATRGVSLEPAGRYPSR